MTDRTLGICALVLAALMTWAGWDIEAPFAYEPVGPRAFPLLIALIIGLCGLRLAIKGGNPVEGNPPGANPRIALMVLGAAAYAFLFQWLGFVIATALMTVYVGRLFGGGWGKSALGGVIMGVFFFLLFDKALDVVLPAGLLGDLL
ncbi:MULTISPECIES: tripartite tricarboxylate transporter TctB family protein [unclassified Bordetella]|uniref:tripartite tricarboxylate transporter TctB family protein n=1 Tax=unclassified Bordetella TaxID=2630031 RepID=UPI00132905AA|nr:MULTISPECIES: tripartite tricarboxylate transporter TctB family protein [unclassified Bordetella]MVW71546.1 tripartite tricarboxylate transporter TctB family protein [Bordetella sp. 15P40C-2]MVW78394.1 tripartite tricarboxylate transporter TctB family protein [Bordetella sp. 02P26C-1]